MKVECYKKIIKKHCVPRIYMRVPAPRNV